MPMAIVYTVNNNNAKHRHGNEAHHDGQSCHIAAVFLIRMAQPRRGLYIALLAVDVRLGLCRGRSGLERGM
jgi:hypothetical protein